MKARARDARFPLLSSNVAAADPQWGGPNVRPSVLLEVGGLKVGLVGVTTRRTPDATDSRNLVGLSVRPLADALASEARRLRAAGADLVIGLAHAGGVCRSFDAPDDVSTCNANAEIFAVAREIPAGLVDIIAAGHTHQAIAHRVNGIAIVQAYSEGRAFSRVDLVVDRATRKLTRSKIFPPRFVCNGRDLQPIGSFAPDACSPAAYEGRPVAFQTAIADVLRDAVELAQSVRDRPLGVTLDTPFPVANRAESPAGNLVVDLMRKARPQAQAAVYNSGGLRAILPAGPLTYGRLYSLVPFDNALAVTHTTAGALGRALARSIGRGSMPSLSGVRGEARCDGGKLSVVVKGADGGALAPDSQLTVVTTDFLASGGDGIFVDRDTPFELEPGPPMRDVIAESLEAGRLSADDPERFDAAHPRIVLPGPLPLRCGTSEE